MFLLSLVVWISGRADSTIKREILGYKKFKIFKNLFSLLKFYKMAFFRIQ